MMHSKRFFRTFRWLNRPAWAAGFLAVGLAVNACATPDSAAAGPAPEVTVSRGTILAMRPVQTGSVSMGAGTTVLNGLAQAASASAGINGQGINAGTDTGAGAAVDFVVRETGGAIIAVVQTNEQHFRIGDPVEIRHADRTRLTRPGI